MKRSFVFFLSTSILFTIFGLQDTEAQKKTQHTNTQYITSDNGLSQSEVTAILKDKKGFLWVGTRGGLNRYDGNNIKVFQNEIGNTNSLINNSIESLFEDKKGNIWIGSKSNGASIYNPNFDEFKHFNNQNHALSVLKNQRVIAISESHENKIWLGTWQNGLYIYNSETNKIEHSLGGLKINDITESSTGEMWIATTNGIYIYDLNGKQHDRLVLDGKYVEFTSILEDKKTNEFYFGTWNEGFFRYNRNTKTYKQFKHSKSNNNSVSSNNCYYLYQDNSNGIWIGTWGGGVTRFTPDTNTFSKINLSKDNPKGGKELYSDVLSIYQDNLGIIWLGTNGGGLCKINQQTNQFNLSYNSNNKLPNEPIWSILIDNNDYLWVGIKGNENIYLSKDKKTFKKLAYSKTPPKNIPTIKNGIKTIYQDLENNLWISNDYSLLQIEEKNNEYSFKVTEIKKEETNEKENLSKVTSMLQSSDKTFWIGTQQHGLRKSISKGTPKDQEFKSYLKDDRISSFLERKNKELWVGTFNGLKLYQPSSDKFKSYKKTINNLTSLSSNIVICLYEDKAENLWIGTPNGLNLLMTNSSNKRQFRSYQQKDGLANNYIHSILEDDNGNLWLTTNKGVSKFNISKNVFYNYTIDNGLLSNSFMEGAAKKDSNGKLYLGNIYGLNIFQPDSIINSTVPPVVLTRLQISGQEIRPGKEYNKRNILKQAIEYNQKITLTHEDEIVSIDFTALDFQSTPGYSYKFKLEGLDNSWNNSTSQKNITYSNLSPGEYVFKVKTSNEDGSLESKEAQLHIKKLPQFWETWQAFLLYTTLFIGLLYLYRHFINKQNSLQNKLEFSRINRKKEEELAESKSQFFTDIAHEFRTPLTLISGPLASLLENNLPKEQQQNQLSTIHYHTQRLLTLVSQLLDFRKSETGKMTLKVVSGDFSKFSNEIFISFRELAESKNISFNFHSNNNDNTLTFDPSKMEIVLCNLLSNAFKYTPSNREISVSINQFNSKSKDFPNGYCEIVVKDNGEGMAKEVVERIFDRFYQVANTKSLNLVGTGIGLALVKNIVKLHKGTVSVKSEISQGSEFTIKLPLGKKHFEANQFNKDQVKSEDPIHYQIERVLPVLKKTPLEENKTSPKLLIVEDNPEIRNFIRNIFSDKFQIIEAENGKIGLQKAIDTKPNIIISDLMMPEMDGLSLCNELRSKNETLHIPIVMLTARTTTVFQEKGYNSGADIYVTKPFHPSVLKAQVEGLLQNRINLKNYFGKKITLQPTELEIPTLDEQFLSKLMKIIEDNLTNEKLNREFLASKMATSPSTLYRKIKGLTDLDTTVFIRSIRLKRAAQMILDKQDNISRIAFQVGFNDLKYFRKCFKEQFGVTPSKYKGN